MLNDRNKNCFALTPEVQAQRPRSSEWNLEISELRSCGGKRKVRIQISGRSALVHVERRLKLGLSDVRLVLRVAL